MSVCKLNFGDHVKNHDIVQIFKCGNMGGMRRSKETNSLVLISDHTKSLYTDYREKNIIFYTGMGKTGNMDLMYAQNKTVYKSKSNNIEMHLFEVREKGQYIYMGRVVLHDEPYQEVQFDANNNPRRVWIFPLKLIDYVDRIVY